MAGINELVGIIADQQGTTKVQARAMIEIVLSALVDGCAMHDSVSFRGFGTFKFKTIPARKGRNPQTGAEITIPEKTKLVFKASK